MNFLQQFLSRLTALFRRTKLDRDMAEEMAAHVERETEQNIARGLPPDEARYAARRAFGGLDQIKERERDARGVPWVERGAADLRAAVRSLARTPGFSAIAVLTLALGLTVNATIFSMVSDLLLRPLPASDPDRLVVLALNLPKFQYALPLSYPDFVDFRRQVDGNGSEAPALAQTFSGLMAYKEEPVHLSRPGAGTERASVHVVSNNYFTVLGINAFRGRLFLPTEGVKPGADPVIVLTHAFWRDRFGSDPEVLGRQVKLNGVAFTIVGVTPPGFVGAAWGTQLSGFVLATMHPQLSPALSGMIFDRGTTGCFIVGRLRPGTSLAQARAACSVMMARLIKEYPGVHAPSGLLVFPERRSRPSPYVARFMPMVLTALMTLAGLVLVVAAANVANLLYARTADRERELAIRGALGASRGRLLLLLVTEAVLLALVAGAVGVFAAGFVEPWITRTTVPEGFAPPAPMGTDWRVFTFTLVASLTTGIGAALLPALRSTRVAILPLLKAGSSASSSARHRWRSLLVVGQIALSCVVLVCAGLAVRSLYQLSRTPLGFRPDHLLIASMDLGLQRYTPEQGARFQARLRERVQELPGVLATSIAEHAPFDTAMSMKGDVSPEGSPPKDNTHFEFTPCQAVDWHYLEVMGMTLAAGRNFDERDTRDRPRVALISPALARELWPDGKAVGRRLLLNQQQPPIEVAGVLGEGRFWKLSGADQRYVFLPWAQGYHGDFRLLVRTAGDPAALASTLVQIVREMDPDLPLSGVQTMENQIARSPNALMPLRIGALVAATQGVIALLLACLGTFGLVSFAVSRRTREIGIRVALGAGWREVLGLVLRDAFRLAAVGVAVGLLLAFVLARPLSGLLYGVRPADPAVYSVVVVVVLATTALACWLPVRRALGVDPVNTLRAE